MDNKQQSKTSFIESTVAAAKAALEKAKRGRKGYNPDDVDLKKHNYDSKSNAQITNSKPFTNILSLKVDSLGRPIDDDGKVIELKPKMQCTLKINQNMQDERVNKVYGCLCR